MNEPDRPAEHLALDDILDMLGETYDDTQERRNARKRLARRLRNLEESSGMQLVFGKEGSRLWTTRQALRLVWPHIIPAEPFEDKISHAVKDIVDQFEDRVATLESQVDVLAAANLRQKRRIDDLVAYVRRAGL